MPIRQNQTEHRHSNSNGDISAIEKIFSRSGVNLMTLFAIIFSAGVFYNQNSAYHDRTEERFKEFADERDKQAAQIIKFEDIQNKTLIQLSSITERMNSQTEVLKDMREILRTPLDPRKK